MGKSPKFSNTIGCWRTQNCMYHSCPRLVSCNLTKLLNNFVLVCTRTFMLVANNSSGCHKSCPKLAAYQLPCRSPVYVGLRYCHYAMACRHRFPFLSALQVCVIDIIWLMTYHRFPTLSALQFRSKLIILALSGRLSATGFPHFLHCRFIESDVH